MQEAPEAAVPDAGFPVGEQPVKVVAGQGSALVLGNGGARWWWSGRVGVEPAMALGEGGEGAQGGNLLVSRGWGGVGLRVRQSLGEVRDGERRPPTLLVLVWMADAAHRPRPHLCETCC